MIISIASLVVLIALSASAVEESSSRNINRVGTLRTALDELDFKGKPKALEFRYWYGERYKATIAAYEFLEITPSYAAKKMEAAVRISLMAFKVREPGTKPSRVELVAQYGIIGGLAMADERLFDKDFKTTYFVDGLGLTVEDGRFWWEGEKPSKRHKLWLYNTILACITSGRVEPVVEAKYEQKRKVSFGDKGKFEAEIYPSRASRFMPIDSAVVSFTIDWFGGFDIINVMVKYDSKGKRFELLQSDENEVLVVSKQGKLWTAYGFSKRPTNDQLKEVGEFLVAKLLNA